MSFRSSILAATAWLWLAPVCAAPVLTFSGNFDDPGDPALVASDLSAARFALPDDVANNVALYGLTLASGGNIGFSSVGHAGGGAEPYFTLFAGSGAAAVFLMSNFADPAIDFNFAVPLVAGDYTLAIGVWFNMSFAENTGSGTLADGFIGLGEPGRLGDASYALLVDLNAGVDPPPPPPLPIPEPSGSALAVAALLACAVARRRRSRQAAPLAQSLPS